MNTRRRCRRIISISFSPPDFLFLSSSLKCKWRHKTFQQWKIFFTKLSLFPSFFFCCAKTNSALSDIKTKYFPLSGLWRRRELTEMPRVVREKAFRFFVDWPSLCHGVVWEAHRLCFPFELICSLTSHHNWRHQQCLSFFYFKAPRWFQKSAA